jgi:hypothetical protein
MLGIGWVVIVVAAALYFPAYFFFPFGLLYIGLGLGRAALFGFLDRLPERDPLRDADEEDAVRPMEDLVTPSLLRFRLGGRWRRTGGRRPGEG